MLKAKIFRWVSHALYWLGTTLLMMWPALYNRYPLMYFDSGAYMEMSIALEPSFHRSMGYPLLMKLTGWGISNWPIVFLQSLLVAWLLFRVIKLFRFSNARLVHFGVVGLLAFSTALPWYSAQLMPDVFSFISVLLFVLLWLDHNSSLLYRIGLASLFTLALITHLSHIPLFGLLFVSILLLYKTGLVPSKLDVSLKRIWAWLAIPILAAFIIISAHNAFHGHGFRLSLSTNVFMVANFGEMGILKLYLDEQCNSSPHRLCDIKDELPKETGGYLWSGEGYVAKHPGGWQGANKDCAPIVHDFLLNPRYLKWLVFSSIKATFKQMFQVELGSGLQYAYKEGTPPFWPMKTHFKQELNEYLISVQNKGDALPLNIFKVLNLLSLALSLGLISWAFMQGELTPEMGLVLILFLLAYFYHAAITGVLANVYDRLQVRVLPLLQLLGFAVGAKYLEVKGWLKDN